MRQYKPEHSRPQKSHFTRYYRLLENGCRLSCLKLSNEKMMACKLSNHNNHSII